MRKVLILYAKYGGGHLSAANALQTYIKENYSQTTEVNCIDCVEYVSKIFSNITTGAYKKMTRKFPNMWKKTYYGAKNGLISAISEKMNHVMARKLNKLLQELNPDIVISTHPFATQMINYLKQCGKTNCKLATILTDFAPHIQWLIGNEYTDLFFVSNNIMKQTLINNYKINEEKIYITGIPLSNKFTHSFSDDETYANYKLKKDKKLLLFFAGGEFGLGQKKTIKTLESLSKYLNKYQIIAVSGLNKKMNIEFNKFANTLGNEDLHILKYTNNVPELMHISSLVITKPGGLTSSESLASSLPMILINPIPGQEEENAEFLEKSGCAIWVKKSSDFSTILDSVLGDENKLNKMKQKIKLIAKPNATADICKIVLGSEGE